MDESLRAGLQLAVIGMGTVVLGLLVVWALIKLLVTLDRPPAPEKPPPPPIPDVDVAIDPALLAAITVAIVTHEAVRRKQAAPAMRTHWPGSLPSRWLTVGRSRQNRTWRSS